MRPEHWEAVRRIYEQGIRTGLATFETEPPSWEEWDKQHLQECRFVAEENSEITGWASLSAVSSRCVYAGVAEVSIYIHEKHRNKGVGTILMEQLIRSSEESGLWTLEAGIFAENLSSIKLHHNFGFKTVGTREKIGQLAGKWFDTMLLERRSTAVGN